MSKGSRGVRTGTLGVGGRKGVMGRLTVTGLGVLTKPLGKFSRRGGELPGKLGLFLGKLGLLGKLDTVVPFEKFQETRDPGARPELGPVGLGGGGG